MRDNILTNRKDAWSEIFPYNSVPIKAQGKGNVISFIFWLEIKQQKTSHKRAFIYKVLFSNLEFWQKGTWN